MHHFISYSSADGKGFALKLAYALEHGLPSLNVWLDKGGLHPGIDWDEQIEHAIRVCESMIFVMTPDSVEHHSVCKNEWIQALRFKKPLVPIRVHVKAELPFLINQRMCINFVDDYDIGLNKLRQHLQWLKTPAGELDALHFRIADANRDLRRAGDVEKPRVIAEINHLESEIERLRSVVENPDTAMAQTQRSIEARMESERKPSRPTAEERRARFINPPPSLAPHYFQDRSIETDFIVQFLRNSSARMMSLVGRGGVGKTALVCRLLTALETGILPDDHGSFDVEGIVYLSEIGSHRINVPNLHNDLCRLLPNDSAKKQLDFYKAAQRSTHEKIVSLVEEFQAKPVLVLLDNLENLIEEGTRKMKDSELLEALSAILESPQHRVKVLITTRVLPQDLTLVQPQRQQTLPLGEGLESPYAEAVLRALDADGTVGLRDAADVVLGEVRLRTRGFPRALESFYGSLIADRSTTLEELLIQAKHTLPENVVESLVGEAFSRLDRTAQMLIQALAIYSRPVPPVAVDFLLQPWLPVIDSTPIFNWLVNMHFVRKEKGRYYLHPVDKSFALGRVPEGVREDCEKIPLPWIQFALRERAAVYFSQIRRKREDWKNLTDLEPQLAEIELRCAAQDYETAAVLLKEIDFNYLFLWGHASMLVELRERMHIHLKDPYMAASNSGHLGNVYCRLGENTKAITHYEDAISIFHKLGHSSDEGVYLGNLGSVFWDIGMLLLAKDYWERAVHLAKTTFQRQAQSAFISNLGMVATALGEFETALVYFDESVKLDHIGFDKSGEAADLAQLGKVYFALGKHQQAEECYQKSILLSQETGDRFIESLAHSYKGMARLCQSDPVRAYDELEAAIEIAQEILFVESISEANMGMALVKLRLGDIASAKIAATIARDANYGRHLPFIYFLLGIVSLHQDESETARQFFEEAARHAFSLLEISPQFFLMHEINALAHWGLALTDSIESIPLASTSYRVARKITVAPGTIMQFMVYYYELSKIDKQKILDPIPS